MYEKIYLKYLFLKLNLGDFIVYIIIFLFINIGLIFRKSLDFWFILG